MSGLLRVSVNTGKYSYWKKTHPL